MKFIPFQSLHYVWTEHVKEKMAYYRLSEQRVRRIIRNPARKEEGVAPNTIAVMQPIVKAGKTTQELWAMYQDRDNDRIVITAWRYPGKSPVRGEIPIPEDIGVGLRTLLDSI